MSTPPKAPRKLITLALWARIRFDPPPPSRTLYRWIEQGKIIPAPIRLGRPYYVEADAVHIAELERGERLIDRLRARD